MLVLNDAICYAPSIWIDQKPCGLRLFEYRSYHSSAESIHPYKAFIRRRYITLTIFSTRTFIFGLGFTSHMMSKNYLSIFNRINLSSGMSELSYSPVTSRIPTYIPSCASMMSLVKKSSREMVGEDASSLVM